MQLYRSLLKNGEILIFSLVFKAFWHNFKINSIHFVSTNVDNFKYTFLAALLKIKNREKLLSQRDIKFFFGPCKICVATPPPPRFRVLFLKSLTLPWWYKEAKFSIYETLILDLTLCSTPFLARTSLSP